ncbi:DUF6119 family protein [Streptomyces sp. RKCA744]|uniref:DUF6119 family protein n=1 Tax=Streptomyces sp. RKCA744 TaxID=2959340 RepID=UPI00209DA5D9|nr:DUF6119 family protein [Streptomyces sp. RKCA744]MCO8305917.1 TIGR04141 family sporadically distributed protein [Streptomyces sp. RKCA744]
MTDTEARTKLRFNCYLLREEINEPLPALRSDCRPGGKKEMSELRVSDAAPSGCRAYLRSKSESKPPWAASLISTFPELDGVINLSNSLVIFLPVGERLFAVCFGYGSSSLEWSSVEPNFGLRFAARCLNSDAVNEIRSRRIDASARTQAVQIPARTAIRDFDLELEGEFVRRMVGEIDTDILDLPDLGAVVATDSIAFKAETDLSSVKEVLALILSKVHGTYAKKDLLFVDALEPLRSTLPMVTDLERLLAHQLFMDRTSSSTEVKTGEVGNLTAHVLSFSPPDGLSVENVHEVVIRRGERYDTLKDMSIDSLREALFASKGSFGRSSLSSIKVIAIDSEGHPASSLMPLKHWLVFEASSDERRYLLTLGKWFALAEEYARRLDADIAAIEDVTDILNLPDWSKGEIAGETPYNADVASKRDDLLLLDTERITSLGDMVEVCDLLHQDGYLIHVKKYEKSQTLSHLFSQGYVSAVLLGADRDYRESFIEFAKGASSLMGDVAERAPQIVTYAIAFKNKRRAITDLPTFSKVNLRDFAKRLTRLRVKPTLARIQII